MSIHERGEEVTTEKGERKGAAGRSSSIGCAIPVLATCGIRSPDEAFENTQSRLLLLADSEEEE